MPVVGSANLSAKSSLPSEQAIFMRVLFISAHLPCCCQLIKLLSMVLRVAESQKSSDS
jgi:hypothetical protein